MFSTTNRASRLNWQSGNPHTGREPDDVFHFLTFLKDKVPASTSDQISCF